jgi:hypothetical protein
MLRLKRKILFELDEFRGKKLEQVLKGEGIKIKDYFTKLFDEDYNRRYTQDENSGFTSKMEKPFNTTKDGQS